MADIYRRSESGTGYHWDDNGGYDYPIYGYEALGNLTPEQWWMLPEDERANLFTREFTGDGSEILFGGGISWNPYEAGALAAPWTIDAATSPEERGKYLAENWNPVYGKGYFPDPNSSLDAGFMYQIGNGSMGMSSTGSQFWKNPDGTYSVQIGSPQDYNLGGGQTQYSNMVVNVDKDGNMIGDPQYVKAERSGSWLDEHPWAVLALPFIPYAAGLAGLGAAGTGAAGAAEGLTAAQIADLGAISGATNAGAGAAFESALANSAFGAAGAGAGAAAAGMTTDEILAQAIADGVPGVEGAYTGVIDPGLGFSTAANEAAGLAALESGMYGAGAAGAGLAGLETELGTAMDSGGNFWDEPYVEPDEFGAPADQGKGFVDTISDAAKDLTLKDVTKLGGLASTGAGLISSLVDSGDNGNATAGNRINMITPYTVTKTRTDAPYITAQQARDYLFGNQPTGTDGLPLTAQRKYFDYDYQKGQSYDPVTGRQYTQDPNTGQYSLAPAATAANGGLMALANGGGVDGHLGGYSDGGRLLRGPGDGVSDSIPATIGGKQPARLADGEFVVPARIVSELGNGSTEAGARKLYAMMDRIQSARKKSVGKGRVAVNSNADKHLPA